VALTDLRRAESREVGVPLYAPAFDFRLLEEIERLEDGSDRPVEAGGLTIGDDEDDDFY
jgi:hypothetical protein